MLPVLKISKDFFKSGGKREEKSTFVRYYYIHPVKICVARTHICLSPGNIIKTCLATW